MITIKIFRLAEDFSSEGGERCVALYSYSGEAESSMSLQVLLIIMVKMLWNYFHDGCDVVDDYDCLRFLNHLCH